MDELPANPKRRWTLVGLGAVLLAIAIIGIALARESSRVRGERAVIAELQGLGAVVKLDDASGDDPARPRRSWLRRILGDNLQVNHVEVHDVNDEVLSRIALLSGLQSLVLHSDDVTDAGMQALAKMPDLQSLAVTSESVSDAGLTPLKSLHSLRTLSISAPQVTDSGLVSLLNLVMLEHLQLEGTQVTANGVERLRESLPSCIIDSPFEKLTSKRVLILCADDSGRSQMAEALWNILGAGEWHAVSAGVKAAGTIHPLAVKAMSEVGLDVSENSGRSLDEIKDESFDLVVSVCDDAQEAAAAVAGSKETLHWSFDDPAQATGTGEDKYAAFQRVRDHIRAKIAEYLEVSQP